MDEILPLSLRVGLALKSLHNLHNEKNLHINEMRDHSVYKLISQVSNTLHFLFNTRKRIYLDSSNFFSRLLYILYAINYFYTYTDYYMTYYNYKMYMAILCLLALHGYIYIEHDTYCTSSYLGSNIGRVCIQSYSTL